MSGGHGFDVQPGNVELVSGCDFTHGRKPEVRNDLFAPAWHNEVGIAIERAQAPSIQVVDMRMRDQDGVDPTRAASPPRQERVK